MNNETAGASHRLAAAHGLESVRLVLERLRRDTLCYFGVSDAELRVENHFPGLYSDVVKITAVGDHNTVSAYVKIAKLHGTDTAAKMQERIQSVFETMAKLHANFSAGEGLSAVRPIACFPELLAIVTEEAKGQTLRALLESRAAWFPSREVMADLTRDLGRIGPWVRRFQATFKCDDESVTLEEMQDYLDVRLKLLVKSRLVEFGPRMREAVLSAFDARAGRLLHSRIPRAAIHADFAMSNIIVDQTAVVVIDFSSPRFGADCHDISHLYFQLGLLTAKPQFRRSVVRDLQHALLAGFDPAMTPTSDLFQLLLLQHVVCHLTGSVQNPSNNLFAYLYNRHIVQRNLRWIQEFV